MLWLAAHHKDKNALGVLSREIAPAGTGMGRSNLSLRVRKPTIFVSDQDLHNLACTFTEAG